MKGINIHANTEGNSILSSNVSYYQRQSLDAIFKPKRVAVIGATEKVGSVGRTILWNLISNSFEGIVFPINPKHESVLGIKAYPTIASLPERPDLAVIVTPAVTVPGIISECNDAGIKAAIIISAGFKEHGPAGSALELQILNILQQSTMRVIGPNCLGVINPLTGLNATFSHTIARPGNVGFISQSGALCSAILDWSLTEQLGFSAFVSAGSMLDVDWSDLIYYLGDDDHTKSIIIYMESIGNARTFLSAAREVALTKPIIVIKSGRSAAAAKAVTSHTGCLTGSDEVFDAAFARCGVLRVDSIAELFYLAEILAKQPLPKGPRLMIFTNAGGPGVLATDALISGGGELAQLSNETIDSLNKILSPHWSHNNPIDILGDASPEQYADALEIAVKDSGCNGILTILTPQAMTNPTEMAERIKTSAQQTGKPILASWMGGATVMTAAQILKQAGIPTFPYPDTAARMFNYLWQYQKNLHSLYETPVAYSDSADCESERRTAQDIIEQARRGGRAILTEHESKQILSAYSIPVNKTFIATSANEAVKIAGEIGYPVVLKLLSETVTHKTNVGGVKLNLTSDKSVRQAFSSIEQSVQEKLGSDNFLGVTVQAMIKLDGYELILGSKIDPQFGPILLFGTGGRLVEAYKDIAIGLPPLTSTLAHRILEQTDIFTALNGIRGYNPVDIATLERTMVNFSKLVVEQRWIKEIDINPLLASADGLIALDARIILHGSDTSDENLPKPAIRPYPAQYVSQWIMKNGHRVIIRPIRPEDENLMVSFHQQLSAKSIYYRYFNMSSIDYRISHERLAKRCFIDYDREMALVVERQDEQNACKEIIAVGRLIKQHNKNSAEFAIIINDQFQGGGLGTELLKRLLQIGREERLSCITGTILLDNIRMQNVCKKLGFHLHYSSEEEAVIAEIAL